MKTNVCSEPHRFLVSFYTADALEDHMYRCHPDKVPHPRPERPRKSRALAEKTGNAINVGRRVKKDTRAPGIPIVASPPVKQAEEREWDPERAER